MAAKVKNRWNIIVLAHALSGALIGGAVAAAGVELQTRHFYVPAGAAALRAGVRPHVRPAGLTVTSPEGREAISGDYPSQSEIEIAVRPEEAGRVWQLRIEPGYQTSLWLAGEAFPYLSISPGQVLAPVAH